MLKTKYRIETWLNKMGVENYTVNEDLTVDVNGSVFLSHEGLNSIPIQFGKVIGGFHCANNSLINLKGCPQYIKDSFFCNNNKISSLEYLPVFIGGLINCMNNPIELINLSDIDDKTINGKCLFKSNSFRMEGFESFYNEKDELDITLHDMKTIILQKRLEQNIFSSTIKRKTQKI